MMLGLIGGTIDQAKRLVDLLSVRGCARGTRARDTVAGYQPALPMAEDDGGRGWHVDRASMDQRAAPRGALMVVRAQELPRRVRPKFETEKHPAL